MTWPCKNQSGCLENRHFAPSPGQSGEPEESCSIRQRSCRLRDKQRRTRRVLGATENSCAYSEDKVAAGCRWWTCDRQTHRGGRGAAVATRSYNNVHPLAIVCGQCSFLRREMVRIHLHLENSHLGKGTLEVTTNFDF